MKKAIYAGTFDPVHKGHISIIKKAVELFDVLTILVANNPEKNSGSLEARKIALEQKIKDLQNIKVDILEEGYIAHYAKKNNIKYLVRSARDKNDFDYELMMAKQNKIFNKDIETIIIMPDEINIEVRSSLLKLKK